MKKITIKDVAKEVGVSIATVSNALNPNSKRVGEKKRKEILKIVEKMGYYPDYNASKIASKNQKNIGLFIRNYGTIDFEDTINMQIIYYMNYYSNLYNIDMVNIYSTKDNEDFSKLIKSKVKSFKFSDIVIFGIDKNDKIINEIEKIEVKKIYIDAPIKSENSFFVAIDNYTAQKEILHYTLEKFKFTSMYYLAGDMKSYVSIERENAVKSFSKKNKINLEFEEGNFSENSGFEMASNLKIKEGIPIFCGSDMIALGAIKYLKQNELKNLVIGFDGNSMMKYIYADFLTIEQDFKSMCEETVKMIVKSKYASQIIQYKLKDLTMDQHVN